MQDQKRLIEKEDWRKAPGIIADEKETNSAFTKRDYKVKCNARYVIAIVKGYHIWWCSAHHQPYGHCEFERLARSAGIGD